MGQQVFEMEFKGRRFRFVAPRRGSTDVFVPLEDLSAALETAMSAGVRRSWQSVLRRRLSAGVDPAAKQRAYLDERIVPTVSSEFVMMLCHGISRLIANDRQLAPAAAGFEEFRRLIYKNIGEVRWRLAVAARESGPRPGTGPQAS